MFFLIDHKPKTRRKVINPTIQHEVIVKSIAKGFGLNIPSIKKCTLPQSFGNNIAKTNIVRMKKIQNDNGAKYLISQPIFTT